MLTKTNLVKIHKFGNLEVQRAWAEGELEL